VNKVAKYLRSQDICLEMDAADKRALFDAIGLHMHREHSLVHDDVVNGLWRREQAGPTGVGNGIAIPHARVNSLARILAFYARLKSPIAFNAPDDRPVSDVLVLLVPKPAADEHLAVLADAVKLFSVEQFRARLHACTDAEQAFKLFSTRVHWSLR
jgi:PTS system nitrogen regulatory IIA component